MEPIVVPLLSRRVQRGQLVQKLNHAIPTFGLIAAGLQALGEGARGFELALAVVEIVTSVVLIGTIARSLRALRQKRPATSHHGDGVDWIDIWAAGVLFAEAAERWHLKHHVARPIILTALLTLALGLFHGRIFQWGQRRRALRIAADGLSVGGRPFKAFSATWKEIASISSAGRYAEIRTRAGLSRSIDLDDLENADAVRAALAEARGRLVT